LKIAVVGAGPGGSLAAWRFASDGASVTVFDPSHPREKPCGGGLPPRALDLLPPVPATDPLPARFVDHAVLESGRGSTVRVALSRPVAVASRLELDAWLLRRAVEAGARHVALRVTGVEADGTVRTAGGAETFDLVVGADGAGSVVRRSLLSPTPRERIAMAVGWFVAGQSDFTVRFTPGLAGYLWLFPRRDHVAVGIAAPLGARPTREIAERLEAEVARSWPALARTDEPRYAHVIPSPSEDPACILEIAGPRFALVGDAAALVDPLTGEGIHSALRSALILAETVRETGTTAAYPGRVLEDFGRELLTAARYRTWFFDETFTDRMVRMSARSGAIRLVLRDLVEGAQAYTTLKSRLVRAAPRLLLDGALSKLGLARG